MNKFMEIAKQNAEKGIANNEGGPFGAIIIDKSGNIISNGNNKVFNVLILLLLPGASTSS